uniref:CMP-N-acetylneuraminic acid synthetase n=1 Tax=Desulfovibrio sp. U5L TaxID=596152 RepID=I2Q7L0_9BACT
MNNADVIALIPARGGSKGIPQKNIRNLAGHPLLAYSIMAARLAASVGRTIVSTDSPEIAAVAKRYGGATPFLRPAAYATDTATDRDYMLHALNWLLESEGRVPEYWVLLRPTTPLREPAVIDRAVATLRTQPEATSLRSGHPCPESPYKWFERDENGYFQGIRPTDPRPEYYNLSRQSFPTVYVPNGYVDILRASHALTSDSLNGPRIHGFVSPVCTEADTLEEFSFLEYTLATQPSPLKDALDRLRKGSSPHA